MKVPEEYLNEICKLGCGEECCSYLGMSPPDGWVCLKGTDLEERTTIRRATGQMTALGDNCKGLNKKDSEKN